MPLMTMRSRSFIGLCLHRDVAFWDCLTGEDNAVGLIIGVERVLDCHRDLAGSHLHLAHAAGADTAGELDSNAEFLGKFEYGLTILDVRRLAIVGKRDQ